MPGEGSLAAQCEARVGTVLRGKWTLERLLGVGGMAAVYVGAHKIGRREAIKILHPEVARSKELKARFEQEAAVVNRFSHPGAVEIRDTDVSEDGCPFLVMELLEGENLTERATRLGGLPTEDLLRWVDELLDVLAGAHAQGIVHRDIKLDNLFVTTEGRLKVLDFGIARVRAGQVQTMAGARLGTTAYMAPEQVRGEAVDGRVDLFAVGATMFRVLAKRRIHEASTEQDLLVKMARDPAPPLASVVPGVDPDLAAVVDRALAFDRDRRYPSAATMQADVRALREHEPPPFALGRAAAERESGVAASPAPFAAEPTAAATPAAAARALVAEATAAASPAASRALASEPTGVAGAAEPPASLRRPPATVALSAASLAPMSQRPGLPTPPPGSLPSASIAMPRVGSLTPPSGSLPAASMAMPPASLATPMPASVAMPPASLATPMPASVAMPVETFSAPPSMPSPYAVYAGAPAPAKKRSALGWVVALLLLGALGAGGFLYLRVSESDAGAAATRRDTDDDDDEARTEPKRTTATASAIAAASEPPPGPTASASPLGTSGLDFDLPLLGGVGATPSGSSGASAAPTAPAGAAPKAAPSPSGPAPDRAAGAAPTATAPPAPTTTSRPAPPPASTGREKEKAEKSKPSGSPTKPRVEVPKTK